MRALEKVNFLLAYDLEPVFDELPDEDAGKLIKAMFDYETKNKLPDFKQGTLLYFAFFTNIKIQMDHNAKRYKERCERNKTNGKLGGRPKETERLKNNQTVIKKPNGYLKTQNNRTVIPKTDNNHSVIKKPEYDCDCDYDCDYDCEYDNDYDKDKDNKDLPPITDKPNGKTNSNTNVNITKKGKDIKTVPQKIKYAEFVSMTEVEHQKLVDKYGVEATDNMITLLDNYKGSKGAKYVNDYRAILSWVVKEYEKREREKPVPKKDESADWSKELDEWLPD